MSSPTSQASAAMPPGGHRDGGAAVRVAVPARVVGVTGTNGKTTTATMIDAIAARAGDASGRSTTVGAWVRGERVVDAEGVEGTRRTLALAAERSVRTMIMETTSYALSRGFAAELPPTIAVFTNLSRDHLAYHGSPESYLAAKAQLFMGLLPGGAAVLNAADPASALLDEVTPPGLRRLGYAARPVDPACAAIPIALAAERVTVDRSGTRVALAPSPLAARLGGELRLPIIGHVHAENALAAAVAAELLGYPPEATREALAAFPGVAGRFQIVGDDGSASGGARPLVVIDYAHTPDALERTLREARGLVEPEKGRVICVFGCGGDRDDGKRPEMGAIADRAADVVVLTTDNPRSEDPERIADRILSGAEGRSAKWIRITDRGRAIREAIAIAQDPDIVVVAGKGHEKVQIFRDRIVPFDDVEVARSAPRAAGGETGRKSRT